MKLFKPRQFRLSIYDVDYQALRRWNFKAIFFDVDNTILPYDETEVSEEAKDLILALKEIGFDIWILSNGKKERVQHITSQLGINGIWKAGKPFLGRFQKARKSAHLKRRDCVVIGDQIFTDVLMANMGGVFSILVQPISLIRDETITKIKRPLERSVIKNMRLKAKGMTDKFAFIRAFRLRNGKGVETSSPEETEN